MKKISANRIKKTLSGYASPKEIDEVISYLDGIKEDDGYSAADIESLRDSKINISGDMIGGNAIIGDDNTIIVVNQLGAKTVDEKLKEILRQKILDDKVLSYMKKLSQDPEFSQWGKDKYFDLMLRQDKSISENEFTFAIKKPKIDSDFAITGPQTIQEAINTFRQLIIIGRPGSGKTTALKSLVVNYADSFLQKDNPTKIVPVFIWLPKIKNFDGSTPLDRFMGLIKASLQRQSFGIDLSDRELYALIKQEQILLLLDGLNEVGDKYLESILDGLETFLSNYPSTLMIIASRFYDFQIGRRKLPVFELLELEYPDGVFEYLSHYLDDRESVESLMDLFTDNLKLRQLTGNPLLLSMIVLIFRSQQDDIPDDRSALLHKISYGLLGQWGQKMDNMENKYWFEDKHRLLQKLGYVMKSEGLELPESRIEEIFGEALDRKELISINDMWRPQQFPEINIRNMGDLINELKHNRILSDMGSTGRMRFWHQALQEYFAARYVLKDISTVNDIGEIIINSDAIKKYVADEGWHEVLSLVGGLILYSDMKANNGDLFSTYIDEIWKRNKSLAASCLNGKADTDQAFFYVKWLENNIFIWGLYLPRLLPWFLLLTLSVLIWMIPEPDRAIGDNIVNALVVIITIFLEMVISLLFFRIYALLLEAYDMFAYRKVIRPGILALRSIGSDVAERALLEFNTSARYEFAVSNYAKEIMKQDQNLLKRTEHELISLLSDSNFQMQAIEHLGQNSTYESRESLVNLLKEKYKDLDWLEYNAAIHSIMHISKLRSEWENDGEIADLLIKIVRDKKIEFRKRLKANATLRNMNRVVKLPGLFRAILIRGFWSLIDLIGNKILVIVPAASFCDQFEGYADYKR